MTYEPCTCGHAKGDHQSNGSRFPHPLTFGICLRCECRKYAAASDEGNLLHAAGFRAKEQAP